MVGQVGKESWRAGSGKQPTRAVTRAGQTMKGQSQTKFHHRHYIRERKLSGQHAQDSISAERAESSPMASTKYVELSRHR